MNYNNYSQDFIYGSIDGIITNFVIVAGVAGANLPNSTIIILGLANTFADAFSMAISRYLSNDKYEWKNAVITLISFIALGIVPLIPFLIKTKNVKRKEKFIKSYILTFIMLSIVGIIKGYILGSSLLYYSFETVLIGGVTSIISYYIANIGAKSIGIKN